MRRAPQHREVEPDDTSAMVKGDDELRIEFLEPFMSEAVRDEHEVEAVHQPPILVEFAMLANGLEQRRTGKRREFGEVHFIERERYCKVDRAAYGGLVLPGQAHDEEALDLDPRVANHARDFAHAGQLCDRDGGCAR